MARAAILIGVLGLATAAHAGGGCEEGRDRTGVGVVVRDGRLVAGEVEAGSVAAASGLRAGDLLAQVNGTVAHSCGEWARTVTDARDGGKALLLLVSRGDGEVPLALGRQTWGVAVVEPGGAVVATPTRVARPVVPEVPAPLPPDVVVSLDTVIVQLGGLVGQTRKGLATYRDAVMNARRAVETLAVRTLAPQDTVASLRRVARLHEAAVLAWAGVDTIRERAGIASRLPVSDAATAPYYSGSPVQSVLDEFEFLQETIAEAPREGRFTESSGSWRAAAARRIAWEHAGEELGRMTATLAAAP